MNDSLQINMKQSDALGVWLMLIASVVSCALFFSWILHSKSASALQSVNSRAASAAEVPTKELKLLVASSELPSPAVPTDSEEQLLSEVPAASTESPVAVSSAVAAEWPKPVELLVVDKATVPAAALVADELTVSAALLATDELPALKEPLMLSELPTPEGSLDTGSLPSSAEQSFDTEPVLPAEPLFNTEEPLLAEPLAATGLPTAEEPSVQAELPTADEPLELTELPSADNPLVLTELSAPEEPIALAEPLVPEQPLVLAELPAHRNRLTAEDTIASVESVLAILPAPDMKNTSAETDMLPSRPANIPTTSIEPTATLSQLDLIRSLVIEASMIDSVDVERQAQALAQQETLESLASVSSQLSFATGSKLITSTAASLLSEVSDTLSLFENIEVVIAVATSESDNAKQNLKLSQERGRAIIARLVSQGVDFSRFSLDAKAGRMDAEQTQSIHIKMRPEFSSKNE